MLDMETKNGIGSFFVDNFLKNSLKRIKLLIKWIYSVDNVDKLNDFCG